MARPISRKTGEAVIKLLTIARDMVKDAHYHVHLDDAIKRIRQLIRREE